MQDRAQLVTSCFMSSWHAFQFLTNNCLSVLVKCLPYIEISKKWVRCCVVVYFVSDMFCGFTTAFVAACERFLIVECLENYKKNFFRGFFEAAVKHCRILGAEVVFSVSLLTFKRYITRILYNRNSLARYGCCL